MNIIVNKLGMKATIPVAQYANIQPEIELQTDNLKEGTAFAMNYIKELFAKYSEKGALKENDSVTIKVKSFNEDVEIDFDPIHHRYYYQGNRLISASSWKDAYYKPFDAPSVAQVCAKSWGVEADSIINMWDSNGKIAIALGNLVEKAIEHVDLYNAMGQVISTKKKDGENPAMPKHPLIRDIVESFMALEVVPEGATLIPQVLVTDVKTLRMGVLDRLVVTGEKKGRIQDYKVNIDAEVEDKKNKALAPFDKLPATKLTQYQLQMSYYADILKESGWTIEGLDALVLEDEWKVFPLEVVNIK